MPRRRKTPEISLDALGLDDPLDAVPLPESDVESRLDNKHLLQVRRRFKPSPGPATLFARLLRSRYEVRIKLDRPGTFYWRQIDGRATLRKISDAMACQFSWNTPVARDAVVRFTRELLDKRLIFLSSLARLAAAAEQNETGESAQEGGENHA